jgi:integrase
MEQTDQLLSKLFAPCIGAYSEHTIKGYSTDLQTFIRWCMMKGFDWLSCTPDQIAQFVDFQVQQNTVSTIKRRLCAIAFAYRICDRVTPTVHFSIRLAVRRASRQKPRRPKQARGLTRDILSKIVAACPDTPAGLRDAALISVGYDTLCRSSELAIMDVRHARFEDDGSATILISRSKSDIAGDGRVAYLSSLTSELLARWLEVSKVQNGPMFRALHLNRLYGSALETSSIRRIVKRATRRAGLDTVIVNELSGHSMRVGAAQDMMVAGFDALAIMQAGGWKSANVVLRYVENAATKELHARRWRLLHNLRQP